jgi:hypothetical protein
MLSLSHLGDGLKPEGNLTMTVQQRDAFNLAIDKLRALRMALEGADSIADQGEADALLLLAFDEVREFESIRDAIDSEPAALAA